MRQPESTMMIAASALSQWVIRSHSGWTRMRGLLAPVFAFPVCESACARVDAFIVPSEYAVALVSGERSHQAMQPAIVFECRVRVLICAGARFQFPLSIDKDRSQVAIGPNAYAMWLICVKVGMQVPLFNRTSAIVFFAL